MPRLFVAIDLPPALKDELAGFGHAIPGARWLPADQLHLTLAFLGDVEPEAQETVIHELTAVAAAPFAMRLRGVGHFPPRGTPRVLWVGIEPCPPLMDLQRQVAAAVRRAGIALEKRKFSPHITLARLKNPPRDRVGAFLAAHNLYAGREFEVGSIVLFSSVLTAAGAVHTPEAEIFLA